MEGEFKIFLGCFGALVASYLIGRALLPKFVEAGDEAERVRQRAWLLTALSSLVCSFAGVGFLVRVAIDGFSGEFGRPDEAADRIICLFFLAYCAADLGAGALDYKSELNWESGWAHHTFYAAGILVLLWRGHANFFTAGLIEELPTLYLASARIRSKAELRWPFAALYFALRILYHVVATFEVLEHSTLAFALGLVIMRQHLWWFGGWWRGSTANAHAAGPQAERFKETNAQLTLYLKLGVCALMVVTQSVTMLHVTFDGYRRRTWANGLLVMLAMGAAWLYFTYEAALIFADTYTRGFIELAIKEQKVIYNISWEDPRVEREALKLSKDDVVLTISSAGCNVLDYLVEGPKHITAVDLNEAQLAVLDLKLACVAAGMPQPDFFALWGRSDPRVFTEYYRKQLRPRLRRDASRAYWDKNADELFRENWMFCGTSGLMAYLLMLIARPLGISGSLQRNLRPDEAHKSGALLDLGIWAVSRPAIWTWAAPLGGIPPEQLALVERRPSVFSERIREILATRMWAPDNYFYHGYCTGQFDPGPKCPRYMSAEHYPKLLSLGERGLLDSVTLFHGSWGDAEPPKSSQGFTFVSLLDSMDWMPPTLAAQLCRDMLGRCERGACRVFWRSYAPGPMLQESSADLFTVHSPALAQLPHSEVTTYDRVGWYLSQWTATVPADLDLQALTPEGSGATYSNSLADDLFVCAAMGLQALKAEKDVAAFYKSQATRYDGFREALLPDRDTFLSHVVPWARVPALLKGPAKPAYALVCVGCGTARDVEFVSEHLKTLPKTARVALCDLSPELLAQARLRVERLGLAERVDLIECDVTKPVKALEKLGLKPGGACVVACSYCLTMIPDWRAAVDNMLALLCSGGALCLVDFTQRFDRAGDPLERLYKAWFACDGVYFNREHVKYLAAKTTPAFYTEHRSRVPYTPLYPTRYLFAGVKA